MTLNTACSLHCSSLFGLTNSILRILKGNPKKGTTIETIGSLWFCTCMRLSIRVVCGCVEGFVVQYRGLHR